MSTKNHYAPTKYMPELWERQQQNNPKIIAVDFSAFICKDTTSKDFNGSMEELKTCS